MKCPGGALACIYALWALTLVFAPEKKLSPSSLLSATFRGSLVTFAQVGQGRLGSCLLLSNLNTFLFF